MSDFYLDSNFLTLYFRPPSPNALHSHLEGWLDEAATRLAGERSVISALVIDEVVYRLVLGWLRDEGTKDPLTAFRADSHSVMKRFGDLLKRLWAGMDSLGLELWPSESQVVERARGLMARPGLAPRDAFHAAHALQAGCSVIVSTDADFDLVPGLKRFGPAAPSRIDRNNRTIRPQP